MHATGDSPLMMEKREQPVVYPHPLRDTHCTTAVVPSPSPTPSWHSTLDSKSGKIQLTLTQKWSSAHRRAPRQGMNTEFSPTDPRYSVKKPSSYPLGEGNSFRCTGHNSKSVHKDRPPKTNTTSSWIKVNCSEKANNGVVLKEGSGTDTLSNRQQPNPQKSRIEVQTIHGTLPAKLILNEDMPQQLQDMFRQKPVVVLEKLPEDFERLIPSLINSTKHVHGTSHSSKDSLKPITKSSPHKSSGQRNQTKSSAHNVSINYSTKPPPSTESQGEGTRSRKVKLDPGYWAKEKHRTADRSHVSSKSQTGSLSVDDKVKGLSSLLTLKLNSGDPLRRGTKNTHRSTSHSSIAKCSDKQKQVSKIAKIAKANYRMNQSSKKRSSSSSTSTSQSRKVSSKHHSGYKHGESSRSSDASMVKSHSRPSDMKDYKSAQTYPVEPILNTNFRESEPSKLQSRNGDLPSKQTATAGPTTHSRKKDVSSVKFMDTDSIRFKLQSISPPPYMGLKQDQLRKPVAKNDIDKKLEELTSLDKPQNKYTTQQHKQTTSVQISFPPPESIRSQISKSTSSSKDNQNIRKITHASVPAKSASFNDTSVPTIIQKDSHNIIQRIQQSTHHGLPALIPDPTQNMAGIRPPISSKSIEPQKPVISLDDHTESQVVGPQSHTSSDAQIKNEPHQTKPQVHDGHKATIPEEGALRAISARPPATPQNQPVPSIKCPAQLNSPCIDDLSVATPITEHLGVSNKETIEKDEMHNVQHQGKEKFTQSSDNHVVEKETVVPPTLTNRTTEDKLQGCLDENLKTFIKDFVQNDATDDNSNNITSQSHLGSYSNSERTMPLKQDITSDKVIPAREISFTKDERLHQDADESIVRSKIEDNVSESAMCSSTEDPKIELVSVVKGEVEIVRKQTKAESVLCAVQENSNQDNITDSSFQNSDDSALSNTKLEEPVAKIPSQCSSELLVSHKTTTEPMEDKILFANPNRWSAQPKVIIEAPAEVVSLGTVSAEMTELPESKPEKRITDELPVKDSVLNLTLHTQETASTDVTKVFPEQEEKPQRDTFISLDMHVDEFMVDSDQSKQPTLDNRQPEDSDGKTLVSERSIQKTSDIKPEMTFIIKDSDNSEVKYMVIALSPSRDGEDESLEDIETSENITLKTAEQELSQTDTTPQQAPDTQERHSLDTTENQDFVDTTKEKQPESTSDTTEEFPKIGTSTDSMQTIELQTPKSGLVSENLDDTHQQLLQITSPSTDMDAIDEQVPMTPSFSDSHNKIEHQDPKIASPSHTINTTEQHGAKTVPSSKPIEIIEHQVPTIAHPQGIIETVEQQASETGPSSYSLDVTGKQNLNIPTAPSITEHLESVPSTKALHDTESETLNSAYSLSIQDTTEQQVPGIATSPRDLDGIEPQAQMTGSALSIRATTELHVTKPIPSPETLSDMLQIDAETASPPSIINITKQQVLKTIPSSAGLVGASQKGMETASAPRSPPGIMNTTKQQVPEAVPSPGGLVDASQKGMETASPPGIMNTTEQQVSKTIPSFEVLDDASQKILELHPPSIRDITEQQVSNTLPSFEDLDDVLQKGLETASPPSIRDITEQQVSKSASSSEVFDDASQKGLATASSPVIMNTTQQQLSKSVPSPEAHDRSQKGPETASPLILRDITEQHFSETVPSPEAVGKVLDDTSQKCPKSGYLRSIIDSTENKIPSLNDIEEQTAKTAPPPKALDDTSSNAPKPASPGSITTAHQCLKTVPPAEALNEAQQEAFQQNLTGQQVPKSVPSPKSHDDIGQQAPNIGSPPSIIDHREHQVVNVVSSFEAVDDSEPQAPPMDCTQQRVSRTVPSSEFLDDTEEQIPRIASPPCCTDTIEEQVSKTVPLSKVLDERKQEVSKIAADEIQDTTEQQVPKIVSSSKVLDAMVNQVPVIPSPSDNPQHVASVSKDLSESTMVSTEKVGAKASEYTEPPIVQEPSPSPIDECTATGVEGSLGIGSVPEQEMNLVIDNVVSLRDEDFTKLEMSQHQEPLVSYSLDEEPKLVIDMEDVDEQNASNSMVGLVTSKCMSDDLTESESEAPCSKEEFEDTDNEAHLSQDASERSDSPQLNLKICESGSEEDEVNTETEGTEQQETEEVEQQPEYSEATSIHQKEPTSMQDNDIDQMNSEMANKSGSSLTQRTGLRPLIVRLSNRVQYDDQIVNDTSTDAESDDTVEEVQPAAPKKRGPGRPRKDRSNMKDSKLQQKVPSKPQQKRGKTQPVVKVIYTRSRRKGDSSLQDPVNPSEYDFRSSDSSLERDNNGMRKKRSTGKEKSKVVQNDEPSVVLKRPRGRPRGPYSKAISRSLEDVKPCFTKRQLSKIRRLQYKEKGKDTEDLPTILPPKRRRLPPATITTRGQQSSEHRLVQEFPQHNWLERKLTDQEATVKNLPSPGKEDEMQTQIEAAPLQHHSEDNPNDEVAQEVKKDEEMSTNHKDVPVEDVLNRTNETPIENEVHDSKSLVGKLVVESNMEGTHLDDVPEVNKDTNGSEPLGDSSDVLPLNLTVKKPSQTGESSDKQGSPTNKTAGLFGGKVKSNAPVQKVQPQIFHPAANQQPPSMPPLIPQPPAESSQHTTPCNLGIEQVTESKQSSRLTDEDSPSAVPPPYTPTVHGTAHSLANESPVISGALTEKAAIVITTVAVPPPTANYTLVRADYQPSIQTIKQTPDITNVTTAPPVIPMVQGQRFVTHQQLPPQPYQGQLQHPILLPAGYHPSMVRPPDSGHQRAQNKPLPPLISTVVHGPPRQQYMRMPMEPLHHGTIPGSQEPPSKVARMSPVQPNPGQNHLTQGQSDCGIHSYPTAPKSQSLPANVSSHVHTPRSIARMPPLQMYGNNQGSTSPQTNITQGAPLAVPTSQPSVQGPMYLPQQTFTGPPVHQEIRTTNAGLALMQKGHLPKDNIATLKRKELDAEYEWHRQEYIRIQELAKQKEREMEDLRKRSEEAGRRLAHMKEARDQQTQQHRQMAWAEQQTKDSSHQSQMIHQHRNVPSKQLNTISWIPDSQLSNAHTVPQAPTNQHYSSCALHVHAPPNIQSGNVMTPDNVSSMPKSNTAQPISQTGVTVVTVPTANQLSTPRPPPSLIRLPPSYEDSICQRIPEKQPTPPIAHKEKSNAAPPPAHKRHTSQEQTPSRGMNPPPAHHNAVEQLASTSSRITSPHTQPLTMSNTSVFVPRRTELIAPNDYFSAKPDQSIGVNVTPPPAHSQRKGFQSSESASPRRISAEIGCSISSPSLIPRPGSYPSGSGSPLRSSTSHSQSQSRETIANVSTIASAQYPPASLQATHSTASPNDSVETSKSTSPSLSASDIIDVLVKATMSRVEKEMEQENNQGLKNLSERHKGDVHALVSMEPRFGSLNKKKSLQGTSSGHVRVVVEAAPVPTTPNTSQNTPHQEIRSSPAQPSSQPPFSSSCDLNIAAPTQEASTTVRTNAAEASPSKTSETENVSEPQDLTVSHRNSKSAGNSTNSSPIPTTPNENETAMAEIKAAGKPATSENMTTKSMDTGELSVSGVRSPLDELVSMSSGTEIVDLTAEGSKQTSQKESSADSQPPLKSPKGLKKGSTGSPDLLDDGMVQSSMNNLDSLLASLKKQALNQNQKHPNTEEENEELIRKELQNAIQKKKMVGIGKTTGPTAAEASKPPQPKVTSPNTKRGSQLKMYRYETPCSQGKPPASSASGPPGTVFHQNQPRASIPQIRPRMPVVMAPPGAAKHPPPPRPPGPNVQVPLQMMHQNLPARVPGPSFQPGMLPNQPGSHIAVPLSQSDKFCQPQQQTSLALMRTSRHPAPPQVSTQQPPPQPYVITPANGQQQAFIPAANPQIAQGQVQHSVPQHFHTVIAPQNMNPVHIRQIRPNQDNIQVGHHIHSQPGQPRPPNSQPVFMQLNQENTMISHGYSGLPQQGHPPHPSHPGHPHHPPGIGQPPAPAQAPHMGRPTNTAGAMQTIQAHLHRPSGPPHPNQSHMVSNQPGDFTPQRPVNPAYQVVQSHPGAPIHTTAPGQHQIQGQFVPGQLTHHLGHVTGGPRANYPMVQMPASSNASIAMGQVGIPNAQPIPGARMSVPIQQQHQQQLQHQQSQHNQHQQQMQHQQMQHQQMQQRIQQQQQHQQQHQHQQQQQQQQKQQHRMAHQQQVQRHLQGTSMKAPGDFHQPILIDDDANVSAVKNTDAKLCDLCMKDATFLCSGCKKVWYCSTWCQSTAWDKHSVTCT